MGASANWLDYTLNWSGVQPPQNVEGVARQVTKIGELFTRISVKPTGAEFWPKVLLGENVPNWPHTEYPVLCYTSSDHATVGELDGVFLRVYESALGAITNPNSWHEWQDISNRAEFNHITQKNNPIYSDSVNGRQTETPTPIVIGNTVYLWYHNQNVNITTAINSGTTYTNQCSIVVQSTNGVDFSNPQLGFPYHPRYLEGDGHTGYLNFGLNTISEIPFTYIGRATHGGAADTAGGAQQIVVSNDAINWQRYKIFGRAQGELLQFIPQGEEDFAYFIESVHDAKPTGNYYRVTGLYRPDVVFGGQDDLARPVEYLVDSDFNIVAEPHEYLSLGNSGSFDDTEIQTPCEFTYDGTTYILYKGKELGQVDRIGIGTITDVPHTWNIFNAFANKTNIISIEADGITASTGLTYSETPSAIERFGGKYTRIAIPQDTTEGNAIVNQSITLSDYQVIDILFDKVGKETFQSLEFEFGLTDSLSNPTRQLNYRFNPSVDPATADPEKMIVKRIGTNSDGEFRSRNYFGQNSNVFAQENPTSKHDLGLRIIPSENKLITLSGVSTMDTIDITGFDYTQPLNIFFKGNLSVVRPEGEVYVAFEKIEVNSYELTQSSVDTTPPVITVTPNNQVITVGDAIPTFTATAMDNVDGNITANIVETGDTVDNNTVGVYTRRWNVSDSAGNAATEVVRTVTVQTTVDTTSPILLVLPGDPIINRIIGQPVPTFTATATDDVDGDITANIVETGDVIDNQTAGTYVRRFNVSDSAGNASPEITRTVIYSEAPQGTIDITSPSLVALDTAFTISAITSVESPFTALWGVIQGAANISNGDTLNPTITATTVQTLKLALTITKDANTYYAETSDIAVISDINNAIVDLMNFPQGVYDVFVRRSIDGAVYKVENANVLTDSDSFEVSLPVIQTTTWIDR